MGDRPCQAPVKRGCFGRILWWRDMYSQGRHDPRQGRDKRLPTSTLPMPLKPGSTLQLRRWGLRGRSAGCLHSQPMPIRFFFLRTRSRTSPDCASNQPWSCLAQHSGRSAC